MSFSIELTFEAELDIAKHKKSGDKKVLNKINTLLNELRMNPTFGTRKPEQLKHYQIPTCLEELRTNTDLFTEYKTKK